LGAQTEWVATISRPEKNPLSQQRISSRAPFSAMFFLTLTPFIHLLVCLNSASLDRPQRSINASARKQLGMRSTFDNAALVHDIDAVGIDYS
jgi:hypothetical protein